VTDRVIGHTKQSWPLTAATVYFVDISSIPLQNGDMKQSVAFFTSYAHADTKDVERLRKFLEPHFRSSANFDFGEWTDHKILPGEHWRGEIEKALEQAHCGLLLLSPAFLSSPFITEQELPVLLAKPMLVPVALQQILLDGSIDLKGLGDRQIFYDSKHRSFDGCRTAPEQRTFALELFSKITALLRKKHAE
jgi:hypothetical protein